MSSSKKVRKDQYEKAATSSRSEDELKEGEEGNLQHQGQKKKISKKAAAWATGGTFTAFLTIYACFAGGVHIGNPLVAYVYCPINKLPASLLQTNAIHGAKNQKDDLRFLTTEIYNKMGADDGVDKYIIWVQMRRWTNNTGSKDYNSSKLLYCSYVTDWATRDCSKAQQKCTLPGAMFFV